MLFLILLSWSPLLILSNPILWTACWNHDGSRFFVGGDEGVLRTYDGESFELLKRDTLSVKESILRLKLHPKENLLAVGMTGPESYIINLETNQKTIVDDHPHGARAIGWNHNGKLLAIGDGEGEVWIWNRKGEVIQRINKGNTISYVGLDWHPRKNQVTLLSKYMRTYNHRGKLLNVTQHREEEVLMLCIQWHPSGDFFALGDYGNPDVPHPPVLQFWKADQTDLQEMRGPKAEIRNIRWSPDGEQLASASDALRIWSKEGELIATGESKDNLWGIDWSPDGTYIITSSEEGHVKLWDTKAKLLRELER